MTWRSSGLSRADQAMQPFERAASIENLFFARGRGDRFQAVIERHDAWSVGLWPKHLRSRRVVSNPVDPGPHGASAVESSKAPPERNMNVLQQVATFFRVALYARASRSSAGPNAAAASAYRCSRPAAAARITHSFQVVA